MASDWHPGAQETRGAGLPPHPAWGAAPLCEVRPAEGQQGPGAGVEGGPEGTKAGGTVTIAGVVRGYLRALWGPPRSDQGDWLRGWLFLSRKDE